VPASKEIEKRARSAFLGVAIGDADTTGAIAGMIAGAFYGLESIPRRWAKRLVPSVHNTIIDLATHLVRQSPMAVKRDSQ
jgi:ADP-ribosyl-[dinitrogen reductase] hydrolase